MTFGDGARDLGALFLAFATLGLGWNVNSYVEDQGAPWWVIVSALLTALSVTIAYTVRAGAIPGWSGIQATVVKLAVNLPAIVSILVVLILELVHITDSQGGGGVGLGVASLALAVALMVQPRSFETGFRSPGGWRLLTVVLVAFAALATLLSPVIDLIRFDDIPAKFMISMLVSTGLVPALLLLVPLVLFITRRPGAGRVLAAVGIGAFVGMWFAYIGRDFASHGFATYLIRAGGDGGMALGGGYSIPFVVVLGLAGAGCVGALAVPLLRSDPVTGTSTEWVGAVRVAMITAVVISLATAISVVVAAIAADGDFADPWTGKVISGLVLMVLTAAAAAAALSMLPRYTGGSLLVPVGILALTAVLALVAVIIGSQDGGMDPSLTPFLTAGLGLPLFSIGALTVPRAIRADFASLMPQPVPHQPQQWAGQQGGQWGQPQQPQQWGPPPAQPQQWGAPPAPQQPQAWGAAPAAPQQWGPPEQSPAQQWGTPPGPGSESGPPAPQWTSNPEQPSPWAPQPGPLPVDPSTESSEQAERPSPQQPQERADDDQQG